MPTPPEQNNRGLQKLCKKRCQLGGKLQGLNTLDLVTTRLPGIENVGCPEQDLKPQTHAHDGRLEQE